MYKFKLPALHSFNAGSLLFGCVIFSSFSISSSLRLKPICSLRFTAIYKDSMWLIIIACPIALVIVAIWLGFVPPPHAGIIIQVRNGADRLWADGVHPHSVILHCGHHIGGGPQVGINVENDDVGVDLRRPQFEFRARSHGVG